MVHNYIASHQVTIDIESVNSFLKFELYGFESSKKRKKDKGKRSWSNWSSALFPVCGIFMVLYSFTNFNGIYKLILLRIHFPFVVLF